MIAVGGAVLSTRPPRYNLLILTVESWRADSLRPEVMPNVLAAARQGRLFTNHRAISAWTIPNIVSLLTGLSPFDQGIHRRGDSLPPDPERPLVRLAREGWLVRGLQAFMHVEGFSNLGTVVEDGQELEPWLARRALDRKPFVLWYHYLGTHLPYAPDPEFRPDWQALLQPSDAAARDRIETVIRQPVIPAGSVAFQPSDAAAIAALHTGAYRQFDAWFGRLWQFLDDSGLAANTIIVLTADHADEHLERGNVGHASTNHAGHLHEELVRVPLVLWLPPGHPDSRAEGVETAPTDHLQVMPSLDRLVSGRRDEAGGLLNPDPARPWIALTSRGGYSDPGADDTFIAARIEGHRKRMIRVVDGRLADSSLYDLTADPDERHPLDTQADGMEPKLVAAVRGMVPPRGPTPVEAGVAVAEAPEWIWPHPGPLSHADLAGRYRLEWTGREGGHYRIEYQAGEGAMQFSGSMDVDGTVKDFGSIDAAYWRTFIVPYGVVRTRVGSGGAWSDWLEVRLQP